MRMGNEPSYFILTVNNKETSLPGILTNHRSFSCKDSIWGVKGTWACKLWPSQLSLGLVNSNHWWDLEGSCWPQNHLQPGLHCSREQLCQPLWELKRPSGNLQSPEWSQWEPRVNKRKHLTSVYIYCKQRDAYSLMKTSTSSWANL